jgi:hypothetical protein
MCLSHLIYTVWPCLIHTCHVMPFFSRPRHSTAIESWPVSYLPAFGFFRLPHGVPRILLSEAYQSSSQRSIPTTVKSGSSTLQKRQSVKVLDWQFGYSRLPRGLSRRARHCQSRAGAWHGMCELTNGMGTAWARHAMCESALRWCTFL